MRKCLSLAVLVAIAVLAVGVAAASATKITGGTTTLTPSAGAAKVLSDNGITVAPLAPATAGSDGSLVFPIRKGHVNKKLRGIVRHRGGFSLTKGSTVAKLRRPTIVSVKRGAFIFAGLKRHGRHHRHHWRVVRAARLSDVSRDGTTVTATVHLTKVSARLFNKLAGHHVVDAGATLGTATIAATVAAK